ncbi:hypothetical protein ZIOFF_044873 [Zingiber officinale]|uniref:cellulase n=1 Tax=Zingiber officinale TaxID=94328 RepID=A0A8J5KUT2_ZINOF|nr:hypothetical protein ZIOFF_044873 [Zingiber officinale]
MGRICVVVCGVLLFMSTAMASVGSAQNPDYKLALSKSLLFFEGQRSGKLPPNQRLTWRKDSALRDGQEGGVRQLAIHTCLPILVSTRNNFLKLNVARKDP